MGAARGLQVVENVPSGPGLHHKRLPSNTTAISSQQDPKRSPAPSSFPAAYAHFHPSDIIKSKPLLIMLTGRCVRAHPTSAASSAATWCLHIRVHCQSPATSAVLPCTTPSRSPACSAARVLSSMRRAPLQYFNLSFCLPSLLTLLHSLIVKKPSETLSYYQGG